MSQRGFSLVELILAIVIISVAVGGVMLVFVVAFTHSANPMQQQQAVAIAEGYLDEILARRYDDPDGSNAGESRSTYDDVSDYNAIVNQSPPRDQDGNVLTGLENYIVNVTVTNSSIGPAGDTVPARRIDVQVTSPPLVDTTLSAYRTEN